MSTRWQRANKEKSDTLVLMREYQEFTTSIRLILPIRGIENMVTNVQLLNPGNFSNSFLIKLFVCVCVRARIHVAAVFANEIPLEFQDLYNPAVARATSRRMRRSAQHLGHGLSSPLILFHPPPSAPELRSAARLVTQTLQ